MATREIMVYGGPSGSMRTISCQHFFSAALRCFGGPFGNCDFDLGSPARLRCGSFLNAPHVTMGASERSNMERSAVLATREPGH